MEGMATRPVLSLPGRGSGRIRPGAAYDRLELARRNYVRELSIRDEHRHRLLSTSRRKSSGMDSGADVPDVLSNQHRESDLILRPIQILSGSSRIPQNNWRNKIVRLLNCPKSLFRNKYI